jgi:hypothetical protein
MMLDQWLHFYSQIGTLSAPYFFKVSVALFGKAGSNHPNERLFFARGEVKQNGKYTTRYPSGKRRESIQASQDI